jgi:hypothetical protein
MATSTQGPGAIHHASETLQDGAEHPVLFLVFFHHLFGLQYSRLQSFSHGNVLISILEKPKELPSELLLGLLLFRDQLGKNNIVILIGGTAYLPA